MVSNSYALLDAIRDINKEVGDKIIIYLTDNPRVASAVHNKIKARTVGVAWGMLEEKVPLQSMIESPMEYDDLKEAVYEYFD